MSKVEAYIEAVRELEGIRAAINDEGETPARRSKLLLATSRVKGAYAQLTGGELGKARRLLAPPKADYGLLPGDIQ